MHRLTHEKQIMGFTHVLQCNLFIVRTPHANQIVSTIKALFTCCTGQVHKHGQAGYEKFIREHSLQLVKTTTHKDGASEFHCPEKGCSHRYSRTNLHCPQNRELQLWLLKISYFAMLRQDKVGINQFHSTCAFIILSWSLTEVKFEVDWNGENLVLHISFFL